MKVGVLGDIHGNASALAAVLGSAERAGIERLLVTGDLVGYYFDAAEVLSMLKSWDVVMTRGNHEDMLAAARAERSLLPNIDKQYGSALSHALDELPADALDMLCNLPHPVPLALGSLCVLLCHGAPWDNNHYVYPDADAETMARCAVPGYDFVIMGHTHYPFLRKMGKVTLLNPGSVGQPRDRRPGAHWALLDSESGEVELRNECYDVSAVAAQARVRHPELPYLANVLTRT